MFLRSIITGSAITAILIVVLVSSRLLKVDLDEKDVVLTEVETVYLDPPPEPELDEPEDELEPETKEIFTEVASISAQELLKSEQEMPALPVSQLKFDPSLAQISLEIPSIDRAPAELPVKRMPVAKPRKDAVAKTRVKPKAKPRVKPKTKLKPKPKPKPRAKAYYGTGELDKLPRELRKGRFSWPSRARGKTGSVKFLLEINTRGKVRVIKVISSTNPQLESSARKVATGSRFTAPMKNGKAVKARFTYTYKLNKPR